MKSMKDRKDALRSTKVKRREKDASNHDNIASSESGRRSSGREDGSGPSQKMSERNREKYEAADAWGSGRADALRMSRIAQKNIDDMRNDFHYCDNGSSREVMDAGSSFSARGGDGGSASRRGVGWPRGCGYRGFI